MNASLKLSICGLTANSGIVEVELFDCKFIYSDYVSFENLKKLFVKASEFYRIDVYEVIITLAGSKKMCYFMSDGFMVALLQYKYFDLAPCSLKHFINAYFEFLNSRLLDKRLTT